MYAITAVGAPVTMAVCEKKENSNQASVRKYGS